MTKTVVFVNHPKSQCGVWQMGSRFYNALSTSNKYDFKYVEVGDPAAVTTFHNVSAVIFNYRNTTLPLYKVESIKRYIPNVPYISIVHEIHIGYQFEPAFSHYLTIDPTYPADNVRIFKTVPEIPRADIPEYIPPADNNIMVGTFGFATDGKGYEIVLDEAAKAFPGCTYNLHMPYATYGDSDGYRARTWGACYANMCVERGIVPVITHDYLDSGELIKRLSKNHLNCLLYAENDGRGVSGAVEYCIAARRPLIISRSKMFRHVQDVLPIWPETSFQDALAAGNAAVLSIYNKWTPDKVRSDCENMLDAIL